MISVKIIFTQSTSPCGFHADHGAFISFSKKESTQHLWNLVCPSAERKFCFPASKYLGKTYFRQTQFSLVPGLPMSFEANGPRIRVPHAWKPHFSEIPVYRLPSNRYPPRETDLGFEFPASNYPEEHHNSPQLLSLQTMFFWPGYKHTHTHTHTHKLFSVRPSFQSRELDWCFGRLVFLK